MGWVNGPEGRRPEIAGIDAQQMQIVGNLLVFKRQPDFPGKGRTRQIMEFETHGGFPAE